MKIRDRRRRVSSIATSLSVGALAVAATLTSASAATPPPSPTALVPTPPTTPTPATPAPTALPTFTPPALPSTTPAPAATAITPERRFRIHTDATGQQRMEAVWPLASTLFTVKELRQLLPNVRAVEAKECTTSRISQAGRTAGLSTCTLELTSAPAAAVPQRLVVTVREFGTPDQIGPQWQQTVARAEAAAAERNGLYTFYPPNALGAWSSLTDGTTTRVLLHRGNLAGEIWFSGIGFTDLKPTYTASRRDYRERVAPALTRLLAAKLNPS